jgi:ornithine cyclodeaminase/alanine dehydrogenase-like protein (mu-crystallin family)
MPQPRFLSAADLKTLLPTAKDWVILVEECLRDIGASGAAAVTGGAVCRAGYTASGLRLPAGSGDVTALLGPDGAPRALLDAAGFAVARDAAAAAVAVKHLGDTKAFEVITLLGGDRLGRALIDALLVVLPNAERMLCFDPDVSRQEQFADEIMTQLNLASIIPPEPREATEGANVLVLNLKQGGSWPSPVIESDWLQRGTLVLGLQPGAGLTPAARNHADRRVTDNLEAAATRFPGEPAPDADLASIVAGKAPGRGAGNPIILYLAFGSPALDAALAGQILQRAETANRGALVPA